MPDRYTVTCFCGAVELEASGRPIRQGYCHCKDCQDWAGAPVNAYTIWPTGAVRVVKGADQIGTYSKSGRAHRKFCKSCGGHLTIDLPGPGLVDIFANLLPGFAFAPTEHINYASRLMAMKDGLPKFKGFPARDGTPSETMPE